MRRKVWDYTIGEVISWLAPGWHASGGRAVSRVAQTEWWQTTEPHKPRKLDRHRRAFWWSSTPTIIALVWVLWLPALYFALRGWVNWRMHGTTARQGLYLLVDRIWYASTAGRFGMGALFWLWLAVALVGVGLIYLLFDSDGMSVMEAGTIVLSLATGVAVFMFAWFPAVFDADKDAIGYPIGKGTTICVADPSLHGSHPPSLDLIYSQVDAQKVQHRDANGKVDWVRIGPVLIKRCTLPVDVWDFDGRSAAYDGGLHSLETKTGTGVGVDAWEPTTTYAYGDAVKGGHAPGVMHPQDNRWTVVLDGSGYAFHTFGVAEWEGGMNQPHTCAFGDKHNVHNLFNRAFNGGHRNSLRNLISEHYPRLSWADSDVSGYCDVQDHPVIVISVTETIGWKAVTQQTPAGIIVLKGSPSGNPDMRYYRNVNAGQYPVPVYPLTVAQYQRESNYWWAGRGNFKAGYGFATSNFASQADNSGEYVLHSLTDDHIYAITPQRPAASKSQQLVNVSMIRVDSVHAGHLNMLTSYVMNNGDRGVVNPANLYSDAQQVLRNSGTVGATFAAQHGELKEFIPLTPTMYRGFGEDTTGATVLYFDLSTKCGSTATLVTVDPNSGGVQSTQKVAVPCPGQGTQQGPGTLHVNDNACAGLNSLGNSSIDAILACQRAAENELINRLKQLAGTTGHGGLPTPSPSASASVTPTPTPTSSRR